jgi:carboxypeptidase C (cathepsin A)
LGRFDSRITGSDAHPGSDRVDFDPSLSHYFSAYTSTANAYLRSLNFESDLPYESLSDRVQPWSFGREGRGYLDVASTLASAMHENPKMKVLFASGYTDLATPYFATDYTLAHMALAPELRKNIKRTMYEGGHMMYHVRESMEKLKSDVAEFIRGAARAGNEDKVAD